MCFFIFYYCAIFPPPLIPIGFLSEGGGYGESLVNNLKLKTKYPKLAKFIKYRSKLQQYYFLVNIVILGEIIIMIIANYLMFIKF